MISILRRINQVTTVREELIFKFLSLKDCDDILTVILNLLVPLCKGASNCMILEHAPTYAFLQIRSPKYQRSVKNFTKRLLFIS